MNELIEKPEVGSPCNGCGMCCSTELCTLARDFIGAIDAPCIALERDGDKMICGLVKRPAWYMFGEDIPESKTGELSVIFASALGFGAGCDSD